MWWLPPSLATSTILLFPNVVIIYKVSLFKILNIDSIAVSVFVVIMVEFDKY